MLEQLELLLELQKIDTDLADMSRQGELLPIRIDEFESERARVRTVQQEREHALEEAKKERQHKEHELEDATIRMNELKAKQILINTMELEAKHDAAKMIRRIENEARSEADRKSQEIIALAVKRYSGDYAAEKIVSVVNLPNE